MFQDKIGNLAFDVVSDLAGQFGKGLFGDSASTDTGSIGGDLGAGLDMIGSDFTSDVQGAIDFVGGSNIGTQLGGFLS